MVFTSTIDQFEFLCTLARCVVGLARFRASVEDVHSLGRLFSAVGFRTWETTVTGHDSTEPSLTPAEFGGSSLLDALHGVQGVFASRGAVTLDLTGTLHHVDTYQSAHKGRVYMLSAGCFALKKRTAFPSLGWTIKPPSLVRPMVSPWLSVFLFWIPGVVVVAGGLLALLSKRAMVRRAAGVMAAVSLLAIITTPWTVPSSPSSAFGHFLGSLLGPLVFLGVGLYSITFSGNIPVGQLSPTDRVTGFVMVALGSAWLLAMHWWLITPTYPNTVNTYWVMFWSTFLLVSPAVGAGLMVLVGVFGHQRQRERNLIGVLSMALFLIGLLALLFDGSSLGREAFGQAVWLAFADVVGLLAGLGAALLVFGAVLVVYERQLVPPVTSSGPSKEHLDRVSFVLHQHVDGGEHDEE